MVSATVGPSARRRISRARRVWAFEVTTTRRCTPCRQAQRAIVRASVSVLEVRRRSRTMASAGTPRPISAVRSRSSLSGKTTPRARSRALPVGGRSRVITTTGAIPLR